MRFIHKWSYVCANFLMARQNENHEKRRVYYYGFQIIIGAIVKGVLLLGATLILRTFIPTMVVMLTFASLRVLAGGYHMDTYGKCIITSLFLFVVAGVIAQYTHSYWALEHILILTALSFVAGLLVFIRWAPADTPNKPITDPGEIKKFKRLSISYVMVWVVLVGIMTYFGAKMLVIAASFGLLLETFTVTPAGYRFFDKISGKPGHHKSAESSLDG